MSGFEFVPDEGFPGVFMSEVVWGDQSADVPDEDDELGEIELEDCCSWGGWLRPGVRPARRVSSICSIWR